MGGKSLKLDLLGRVREARTVLSSDPEEVISHFALGFNRVGDLAYDQRRHEPTSLTPEYRTRAMTTDLAGRLTGWAEGGLPSGLPILPAEPDPASIIATPTAKEDWQLDPSGNWTGHSLDLGGGAVTESYDAANPLNQYTHKTIDQNSFAYQQDWLGQLRLDEEQQQAYVWDPFGRLTEIRNSATGSVNERLRYDAGNRRVERQLLSGQSATDPVTRFAYDGWRTIDERAVEGGTEIVRARYAYGLALDDVLWMDRDVPRTAGAPDPVNGTPSGDIEARYFIHGDFVGNTIALTQGSGGSVAERVTYSAFGQAQIWTDPEWTIGAGYPGIPQGISNLGFPYLFTGQRFDAESGLHYFKNRYLGSRTGRFLSRDFLGYAEGPNLYLYGLSNPVMYRDSLGLAPEPTSANEVLLKQAMQGFWGPDGTARFKQHCTVGVQWKNCGEYVNAVKAWNDSPGYEPARPTRSQLDCPYDDCIDVKPKCKYDACIEVKPKKGSIDIDAPPGVGPDWSAFDEDRGPSEYVYVTYGYKYSRLPPFKHVVVIGTDPATGKSYATRGGPGLGSGGQCCVIFGESGEFDESFADPPSVQLILEAVGTVNISFEEFVARADEFADVTNSNQVPYLGATSNSNSYGFTFGESLGLGRSTPPVSTPGWQAGSPSPELSYLEGGP